MSKWVCAWGLPTSYVNESLGNLMEKTTVRYIFFNPLKGEKIRLCFSNIYGTRDVVISEAYIAEWAGKKSAVLPETIKQVTFNGKSGNLKAGEDLISDEITFNTEPGKSYAVSLYFDGITPIETGITNASAAAFRPAFFSRGNHAGQEELPLLMHMETTNYIFLNGVDVLSGDDSSAIMAFGDSITGLPWPDFLSVRINELGITNRAVVRKGIGGNRVLRDYRHTLVKRRMGISALQRFEYDLLRISGVDRVIMLEGINDLCHPKTNNPFSPIEELPTIEELINGYKFCCDIAHKYGTKFYLATILPTPLTIEQPDNREERRQKINEWIRTNDYTDGFIDFEAAVIDKDKPNYMLPEYDRGDFLHPSNEGSRVMAYSIPEEIFR